MSVQLLLGWIQQSPLLLGEDHSHILKGHQHLRHVTYFYVKCETPNTADLTNFIRGSRDALSSECSLPVLLITLLRSIHSHILSQDNPDAKLKLFVIFTTEWQYPQCFCGIKTFLCALKHLSKQSSEAGRGGACL